MLKNWLIIIMVGWLLAACAGGSGQDSKADANGERGGDDSQAVKLGGYVDSGGTWKVR